MDALFQRNQCPSLSPTARWGLWVLIISLLSICRGGATNHTTIKTLIYCCPAPGDLTELQASKAGLSRPCSWSQWSVVTAGHPM